MTKITMDGKYQTRDGRPVRVVCVDSKGARPVVALISEFGGETTQHYLANGKEYLVQEDAANDLIPVPEKRRVKFWVNVYENGSTGGCTYGSKEAADLCAAKGRVDCLEIDREFTVGEGL